MSSVDVVPFVIFPLFHCCRYLEYHSTARQWNKIISFIIYRINDFFLLFFHSLLLVLLLLLMMFSGVAMKLLCHIVINFKFILIHYNITFLINVIHTILWSFRNFLSDIIWSWMRFDLIYDEYLDFWMVLHS